ncbi:MAG: 6-phosphogluconolactonase [Candidatus Limnocylindria bacterium]
MTAASLEIVPAASFGEVVAARLADRLVARPSLVVCLPTGRTPLPLYERLPAAVAARSASLAGATVVLLDEYLGLPAGHGARCDTVLRREVIDRSDPPPRFVPFDVDRADPPEACAAVDAAIAANGGLDLVILGLGANGHVGMNEPGAAPDAPTRVVELAASTREAARGYGADPPPSHGVTVGMAAIAAAREIWLLATGTAKAAILARTVDGPISVEVPASLLRPHAGLRIIADDAAAAALRRR